MRYTSRVEAISTGICYFLTYQLSCQILLLSFFMLCFIFHQHLYWLPVEIPSGVSMVLSTSSSDSASQDILLRERQYVPMNIEGLSKAVRMEMCLVSIREGKQYALQLRQRATEPLTLLKVGSEFGKKRQCMGQAEQDPDLPRLASNVLGKVQSRLGFTEWRGKGKCRRGICQH